MSEVQKWTSEFELSDEDKTTLSKYESPLLALQGGANASRLSGSPDRVIKGFESLDMEKLDDKQKESVHTHIKKIQGVPDGPEGYNIERPETMPEGMEYDIGLENWFRKEVHAAGGSNALVSSLVTAWNKRGFGAHEASENQAKETEEKMLAEMGQEKFTAAFGKAGDPNQIGNVKRCLIAASKELNLDYKDDKGFPQSHLLDGLEQNRKGGRIGDKAPVMKFVNWVYNKFMATGGTEGGEAPGGHQNAEQERIANNKRDFPNSPWMHH